MGSRELIESLRAAGDGKVRALRAVAEEEAERVRSEAARRIGAIHQSHEREREAEAAKQAEALLAEANAEARRIRLQADRALADRLAALARKSLPSLRNVGYTGVFDAFVQELPRLGWRAVRVHPADRELAASRFPDAEVLTDEDISGGLVALTEGGRVQVVNTFETRLARRWEEMLPDIMREVREACR